MLQSMGSQRHDWAAELEVFFIISTGGRMLVGRARDASEHSVMYRAAPLNNKSPSRKCQWG